jgi:flagellar basal body-associated protein FliL
MSNAIAVVIAVIGILALFAAAGALFLALRKSGSHPVAARQEAAAGEAALSPELAAEAERRIAEADLVAAQAQRQLDERASRPGERTVT